MYTDMSISLNVICMYQYLYDYVQYTCYMCIYIHLNCVCMRMSMRFDTNINVINIINIKYINVNVINRTSLIYTNINLTRSISISFNLPTYLSDPSDPIPVSAKMERRNIGLKDHHQVLRLLLQATSGRS